MKIFNAIFSAFAHKSYEKEKKVASSGSVAKRRKLAASKKAHPEILFYLADDKDTQTRRAVAANAHTPVQAAPVLAKDKDADVKIALANRLVKLLPELADEMHSQLYSFAVKSLHTLARDEVAKVRVSLSSALKDHAYAPPAVVKKLAMDVERAVSQPILQYCTRLSDEDLLEILKQHPSGWVAQAMAMRKNISDAVMKEMVDCFDEAGGLELLNNDKTRINDHNLSRIVEKSRDYISWQEPIALRPELKYAHARQLAGFASDTVLDTLSRRKDFDKQTAVEVSEMVRRRMAFAANESPHETLEQKVNRYAAAGKLNAETISDALAWREEGFVKLAISRISGVHQLIVDKIFASESPRSIVSLCWYAGLPMRLAVELQKILGHVQAKSLIYAKAGVGYPLPEADMIWQLEFFGIEVEVSALAESHPASNK